MATKETKEERAARHAALIEQANKIVPMNIRFGKELADKLRALGYDQPERLLFVEAQSLGLSADEASLIRKYQKRYLPKPSKRNPRRVKGTELKRIQSAFAANRHADAVEHPRTVWFTTDHILVLEGDGTGLLFEGR